MPVGIKIGDDFETVLTKFNAPEKDMRKILGVDDLSKWDGKEISLDTNIYVALYEEMVGWNEESIKDNYFSLTYDRQNRCMKLNFDKEARLVSIEYIFQNKG